MSTMLSLLSPVGGARPCRQCYVVLQRRRALNKPRGTTVLASVLRSYGGSRLSRSLLLPAPCRHCELFISIRSRELGLNHFNNTHGGCRGNTPTTFLLW
ncbi:hypothetical protein NDU88_007303 [Pleurodeles waltl]|uniref:Secreted protein n=1 Tax=Pleurodeles waltl TaxID=8319 RepID=A0AAV7VQC9_PLEWA|nr:hypothetical protein NDU88_007303 [Pleurodeles waltl]